MNTINDRTFKSKRHEIEKTLFGKIDLLDRIVKRVNVNFRCDNLSVTPYYVVVLDIRNENDCIVEFFASENIEKMFESVIQWADNKTEI